ncbi:MAG TPA: dTDP-4-dehydrorhamnose reductase [Ilumatobacter sp.]|nr:dTDP-4-dehydrorhamnose reductase [Ilumatobacter sp.]
MRVLVTGANGQLGRDLVEVCTAAGDDVVAAGRAELDVGDRDAVASCVEGVRPDVIVNCAAWTAVDACESDPARAQRDNADAVRWLRAAADRVGAHLVQISTDYVFSGDLDRPYRETDTTGPRSVYGHTKLAGELAAGPEATIVRTSWVCGEHGANMVKTVLRLLAGGPPELTFVADQRGNPTFTTDLAGRVRELAAARAQGVFHATNAATGADGAPGVSWYEFVCEIVSAAGGDPSIVRPITTAELQPPRPAARPANSVLADTQLAPLRDFRAPLGELVARLQTRPNG